MFRRQLDNHLIWTSQKTITVASPLGLILSPAVVFLLDLPGVRKQLVANMPSCPIEQMFNIAWHIGTTVSEPIRTTSDNFSQHNLWHLPSE